MKRPEEEAAAELEAFLEHDREDARFERWLVGVVVVLAIAFACGPAYADAPAPAPKAKPRVVATPSPEPLICGEGIEGDGVDCNCFDQSTDPRTWVECLPPTIRTRSVARRDVVGPEVTAESPVLPTTPEPSPSPSLIHEANAAGFEVRSLVGAMVVTTSESGTGMTPTISVDAEGPLAFGQGSSLGRVGARLILTASPGQAADGTDPTNYKGVEVDLRVARVVGVIGGVRTVALLEYGFTTLIKGSTQARPLQGLSHSFGAGFSFESKDGAAQLAILPGFDEATTTCGPLVVCTGLRSGFAILIYGQVPILDGKVLFGGDVSIAGAPSDALVTRTSVERVFSVIDPVAVFRKPKPAPAASRSAALVAADAIRKERVR